MKCLTLTLALVPVIIFAYVYFLAKFSGWAVRKDTAFSVSLYAALGMTVGFIAVGSIWLCVWYPFHAH